MMRSLIFSAIVLAFGMSSPVLAAGTYGSIDTGYLGRPGPSMGNGGRFDFDTVDASGLNLPAGWQLNQYDSPSTVVSGGIDGADDLFTFCVETSQHVPAVSTDAQPAVKTYDVNPVGIGSALDRLGDYYWVLASQTGNGAGVNTDNVQAGAFQLAAWTLKFGFSDLSSFLSDPLSSPIGTYTQDAKNLATDWLASVTGSNALADLPDTRMVFLGNGGFQDQVTQISAVPEAAALIVWSFVGGAIGLVVYRQHVLGRPAGSFPLS